ncbi:MAG: hypothetical protein ACM33T_17235 [Solirubrobacterales bacterium]
MSRRAGAGRARERVEWMRWLRDPRHWERFYDQLATQTFAAMSKEISDGKWPDEAADLAIEDVSARMRADGVPEEVVVSYREEYLKHRRQLVEVAGEISDVIPGPRSEGEAGETEAPAMTLPPTPMLLPLWLAKTYWGAAAHTLQEMERWFANEAPVPERRLPELVWDFRRPGETGRRRRDLNVERL